MLRCHSPCVEDFFEFFNGFKLSCCIVAFHILDCTCEKIHCMYDAIFWCERGLLKVFVEEVHCIGDSDMFCLATKYSEASVML